MAYVKQNFEAGQKLTADHMNHIENGIEQIEKELPEVIEDITTNALSKAKESGEFNGPQGEPGVQGPAGPEGQRGEQGPAYTLTDTDKNTIAAAVKSSLNKENWMFTLEGGSIETKTVYIG